MKTIEELLGDLRDGTATAVQVVENYKKVIQEKNPQINAFVGLNEGAEERARKVDNGKLSGKLAGIPIAIKDLFCHQGLATSAASKILQGFVPTYSSTVTRRLEKEGAILIGKTNLDEFAMGSSNENSAFGAVKNPWDESCVAGGSSGGSAAAVAAGMAPVAIGTDTGGSIRQPASFCGLVGLKPTYGRVSRFGIVAFASSLDQAGPMALTVKDAATVLEVIAGHDPKDSTTSSQPVPSWSESLHGEIKGKKIGLIKEFSLDQVSADTGAVFSETLDYLKSKGAEVREVSLPSIRHSVPVYYLIATSEASSNLARYDGVRYGFRKELGQRKEKDLESLYKQTRGEGFGSEVKRRILLGTFALSSGYYDAYYLKACQVRRLILDDFEKAFKDCDVLMSPVTASPAFKIGAKIDDPLEMYLNDIFTTSANLAGLPGISVPVGLSSQGLPIGLQILAPHFAEQRLFDMAFAVESRQEWRENRVKERGGHGVQ